MLGVKETINNVRIGKKTDIKIVEMPYKHCNLFFPNTKKGAN